MELKKCFCPCLPRSLSDMLRSLNDRLDVEFPIKVVASVREMKTAKFNLSICMRQATEWLPLILVQRDRSITIERM